MLNLIVENKEFLKIIYALIITLICAIIVLKTDRLFRLSLHKGIRYFRNAFFFFGMGFIVRYFLYGFPRYNFITLSLFKFFFIMAGFFLLYSLLWKKIEASKANYASSFFNLNILIFYTMSFVIIFLDYLWKTGVFTFFSQITLFTFAAIISFVNYKRNGRRHKFLKFYFIAMIMSLIAWLLNAFLELLFNWNYRVIIAVYLLNIIIFLLFLYGVMKVTK
jgi:hypothetical protein